MSITKKLDLARIKLRFHKKTIKYTLLNSLKIVKDKYGGHIDACDFAI